LNNKIRVCIAGKNNIAVNALNYLITNYQSKIDLCCLPNPNDRGEDGWQFSFKKYCDENKINRVEVEELRKIKDLIFISLEYSEIIDTKYFLTNELFNIHFSLLPKYRGMYTSAMPIINGEQESGVTLHKIDNGIDTGDIIDQLCFKITANDTARDLYYKYLDYGFDLFKNNIEALLNKKYKCYKQPIFNASYYSKKTINFNDLKINFFKSAYEVNNQIRSFIFREFQLPKFNNWGINRTEILHERSFKKPGYIFSEDMTSFVVSTNDYKIKLYKDYYDELWSVCENGNSKRLFEIIPHIPNIKLKNRNNLDAIAIAESKNHHDLIKILLKHV
jgi:methionyl-tRNA formyltransferase